MVKQISVFVENKAGSLKEVIQTLAESNINISALSVADTTEFGIARMIVDNAVLAQEVLSNDGVTVRVSDITAIAVDDEPGALMKTLDILSENDISVEYMYAFGEKLNGRSVIAIRTDNSALAEDCLAKGSIHVLGHSDIEEL